MGKRKRRSKGKGKGGKKNHWREYIRAVFLYCIALINYNVSIIYIFGMCFSNKKRKILCAKLKKRRKKLSIYYNN